MDFEKWIAFVLLTIAFSSAFGGNKRDSKKPPSTTHGLLKLPAANVALQLFIDGTPKGSVSTKDKDNFERIAVEFEAECLSLLPINDDMPEWTLMYNGGTLPHLTVESFLFKEEHLALMGTPVKAADGKYHLKVYGSRTAMMQVDFKRDQVDIWAWELKHFTMNTKLSVVAKHFGVPTLFVLQPKQGLQPVPEDHPLVSIIRPDLGNKTVVFGTKWI